MVLRRNIYVWILQEVILSNWERASRNLKIVKTQRGSSWSICSLCLCVVYAVFLIPDGSDPNLSLSPILLLFFKKNQNIERGRRNYFGFPVWKSFLLFSRRRNSFKKFFYCLPTSIVSLPFFPPYFSLSLSFFFVSFFKPNLKRLVFHTRVRSKANYRSRISKSYDSYIYDLTMFYNSLKRFVKIVIKLFI